MSGRADSGEDGLHSLVFCVLSSVVAGLLLCQCGNNVARAQTESARRALGFQR